MSEKQSNPKLRRLIGGLSLGAMAAFLIFQYQNCSPSANQGALTLGAGLGKASSTGSNSLAISITPSTTNLVINNAQVYTATPSGGIPPYSLAWSLQGASTCAANSLSCSVSFASAGNYSLAATVTDSAKNVISSTVNITVGTTASSSSSTSTTTTGGGTSCNAAYGQIESVTVDGACNVTISGWAWNISLGQSTSVYVYTPNVMGCQTTVSLTRSDIAGSNSCVTGKSGFTCVTKLSSWPGGTISVYGQVLLGTLIGSGAAANTNTVNVSVPYCSPPSTGSGGNDGNGPG